MLLHISGYHFCVLTHLPILREQLLVLTQAHDLKGTIFLSAEGINISLAGATEKMQAFIEKFRQDSRFCAMTFISSSCDVPPFHRLWIKFKSELVPLREPVVSPSTHPTSYVQPLELKGWLDAGEEVILLDARNAHEFARGTFQKAIHLEIKAFYEFAKKADVLPEEWRHKKIVTFCTGGIRCEKAAPWLKASGFSNVYQLKGGILRYLEECADAHYQGECFVFDDREVVDRGTLRTL